MSNSKNISEEKSNLTEALYHTYELIKATDDPELLFHLSQLAFNIATPFRFKYPDIDAIGLELNEWALLKREKDNEWSQETAKEMEAEFTNWSKSIAANTAYSLEPKLKIELKRLFKQIEKTVDAKILQKLSESAHSLYQEYNESLPSLADVAQGLGEWADLKSKEDEQSRVKAKEYFEHFKGNHLFEEL